MKQAMNAVVYDLDHKVEEARRQEDTPGSK